MNSNTAERGIDHDPNVVSDVEKEWISETEIHESEPQQSEDDEVNPEDSKFIDGANETQYFDSHDINSFQVELSEDDIENLEEEQEDDEQEEEQDEDNEPEGTTEIHEEAGQEDAEEPEEQEDPEEQDKVEEPEEIEEPEENGELVFIDETAPTEPQHTGNAPADENEVEHKDPNGVDDGFTVPVYITISGDDYLLLPFDKPSSLDLSSLISLFDEPDITTTSIEDFFGLLRNNEDLMDMYNFQVSDELMLHIPELGGLSITEDNVYSRDITLDDFIKAFNTLKQNSSEDEDIPAKMTLSINTQPRFITKFNSLSECIDHGKGFKEIMPIRKRQHDREQSEESEDTKRVKLST